MKTKIFTSCLKLSLMGFGLFVMSSCNSDSGSHTFSWVDIIQGGICLGSLIAIARTLNQRSSIVPEVKN